MPRVNYWEGRLELGCVSAIDSNGRTIWIVDAHRDDGRRFIVRADEILSAFVELERQVLTAFYLESIHADSCQNEWRNNLVVVTFHYKTDTNETPQFGLIAEEVAKVNPALVLPDKEGKPYTVRYDAVNAMLLNEFLKEHRKTEKLEATVAQQQKQIETLAAGLQKISAQLELNRAAPETVLNDH